MFGGLAFIFHGIVIFGVQRGGGVFRLGKANAAATLALSGVKPMQFTRRRMGGMVSATDEAMADDEARTAPMRLALAHVETLPPK